MCWRQVTKFQKTVLIAILYSIIYYVVSSSVIPETRYTFLSDDIRIGDKFILIYLSTLAPVISDLDGYTIFKTCGNCFLTNNKGFAPMSEFDAVLVVRDRSFIESVAFLDPSKSFFLKADEECIMKKLVGCKKKPAAVPIGGGTSYDLCGLCQRLLKKRTRSA